MNLSNPKKHKPVQVLVILFAIIGYSNLSHAQNATTVWHLAELLKSQSPLHAISGDPQVVESPYGEAVYFDGVDDAIFLDNMPLKDLNSFTVEMIFKPDLKGNFEQRVLHMGAVSDDRMLLEIRAVDTSWYFDGFAKSKAHKKALIDEDLKHPLQKWYHVAFVVSENELKTFVNGQLELQENFEFLPIQTGKTSIGVRLNKRSWFKGSIYSIKITPKVLKPSEFNTPI